MKTIKLKSKTYRKTKKIVLLICWTLLFLFLLLSVIESLLHIHIPYLFVLFIFTLLPYLLFNNIFEEIIEENKSSEAS